MPSRRITALAPALAAVMETVRTTVATAKGSPLVFRLTTVSMWSVGDGMRPSLLYRRARYGSSAARLSSVWAGAKRSMWGSASAMPRAVGS